MAKLWLCGVLVSLLVAEYSSALDVNISIDLTTAKSLPLPHFWETTGWCPPAPQIPQAIEAYALQESSWQLHANIAAVPYNGIKIVRIHNLLFMIEVPEEAESPIDVSKFNYTRLDRVVDMLVVEFGLHIGFEIMGNPQVVSSNNTALQGVFTDWGDVTQLIAWQHMVTAIATRYTSKYGVDVVRKWKWEAWNEPDHNCNAKSKMKAGINCDVESWLGYFDACANGLRNVDPLLLWGGPGTGGATLNKPSFLVAMLTHVAKSGNKTKLDYIQWHEKGYATNTGVDVKIAQTCVDTAPAITASIPMGNEEVDPLGGWNKVQSWRGDARYPAAAAKILLLHQHKLREGMNTTINYAYHSNDNAFLNYGDEWFDQRTLTVRFLMNKTNTVEVIRKPVINLMALLALLGDTKYLLSETTAPSLETSPFGVLCTTRKAVEATDPSEVVVLMYNSGPDLTVVNETSINTEVMIKLPLNVGNTAPIVTHYRIDNTHSSARQQWSVFGGSANPYPSAQQFEQLRNASALTVLSREQVSVSSQHTVSLKTTLPEPSISLFQLCFPQAHPMAPPKTTGLRLRVTPTQTPPTVFVYWQGSTSRCLATYQVFVSNTTTTNNSSNNNNSNNNNAATNRTAKTSNRTATTNSMSSVPATINNNDIINNNNNDDNTIYTQINTADLIFSAHVFTQPQLSHARGCVKVRAVDVWGVEGEFSDVVCV